jgi:hypothetical protein
MDTTNPITNQRKARCRHCRSMLLPGQGSGYPSQFGYGGGNIYYCPACTAARQKREADDAAVKVNLQTIAACLEQRFGGPVDTAHYFGAISLQNIASALYGRMRNLIYASGMYALEASQAIVPAIADAPELGSHALFALAEAAALQTLAEIYHQHGNLPWVAYPLVQAVLQTQPDLSYTYARTL